MVTTVDRNVRLTTAKWCDVSVSAACANRSRSVPGTDDTFTIQVPPHQDELAQLLPMLHAAGVNSTIQQAAVWIVTDDASYDDLGILENVFGRAIREREAAHAMMIYDMSGFDITQRNIWRDRQAILNGLGDSEVELRTWLTHRRYAV
jgi:hypothetical protein